MIENQREHPDLVHSTSTNAPKSVDNRLSGVDFLRAAACMMVVLHHLVFRLDQSKAPEALQPLLHFFYNGSFGVSVFFMLSGFLLARPFWLALVEGKPMPSMRVYVLRRAARILPGFWLALTVTFLLSFLVLGTELDGQLVLRYLAGFFLVSDWHWMTLFPVEFNGPLWSIGFEITSYLLLPLALCPLFMLSANRPSLPVLLGGWAVVLGLVLLLHWQIVLHAPIDEFERGWEHGIVGGAKAWMPNYNPVGFFAIFALGALFAGVQLLVRDKRGWLFDALALIGVVLLGVIVANTVGENSEGYGWLNIPYAFPVLPLAAGLVLAAAPSSMLFGKIADNRLSRYIARVSFGVYLWHFLIIVLVARFVPPAFDNAHPDVWPIWIASSMGVIVLTFALATASFRWLEQPVIDWARKLEKKRKAPVVQEQRFEGAGGSARLAR